MEEGKDLISQYKIPLILGLVGVVLVAGSFISSNLSKPQSAADFPKESIVDVNLSQIKVDIGGAVKNPGVYSFSRGERVEDVIAKAGGFAGNANSEYISKSLNLSQKISDGQKIYIPFEGESGLSQVAGMGVPGKIGINSASSSQLEELPGVGPATAAKIIGARPYQSLEELLAKKALSKSVYEKVKDLVDLN